MFQYQLLNSFIIIIIALNKFNSFNIDLFNLI